LNRAERLRLFVAADIDAPHLTRIQELTGELQGSLPPARWIPRENQHITLKFLGATSPDLLGAVSGVCAAVAARHGKERVSLSRLGAFPNPARARVLWVGVVDRAEILERLASDLDRGFTPLGFTAEARGFTPHLTLARFKAPARLGALPAFSTEELPPVSVDHLSLYRSRLSPRGAVYELIDSFALA
jgi:2'-5' RNA ligase